MMEKLSKLRGRMTEDGLEALLVSSTYNRRYISGFTGTSGYVLITMDRALLITDFRYIEQAAVEVPHFDVIRHEAGINDELIQQLKEANIGRVGFEKQYVSYALYENLQQAGGDAIEWIGSAELIEDLRLIKGPEEIAVIKQACLIADRTFAHILTYIKAGMTERDVEMEMEFHMRRQGATSSSFDIIVASGERSALPHGVASDKKIESGDMITLDFGAYYNGYVSDITRTIAVGDPSDKMKEIYQVVLDAQLAGVASIKPGMTGAEADALTRDVITKAGYGAYFGHGTGHGIGLEIHEGPRLSPNSTQVLKPGMVATVEPGIYIAQTGGVRIEDDVLITDEGCEILTSSPKELIVL